MDQEKRERRKLKKAVKRAGNRHRRAQFKRDLRVAPEEAAHSEERLGRFRSQDMNGQDVDATRRRQSEP